MKKILVTGSDGQLGRAVNKEFANDEYELINSDVFEKEGIIPLDITDVKGVTDLVREIRPFAIINCAAYTAVDAQEKDKDRAFQINAIGPRNLAIAAEDTGARLLHISTDYVFSGQHDRPYVETDETGPVSTYGRTKLQGENFVKAFSRHYYIIRTAWLYGDGKNFVRTMLKASETRDEVSVVNDQLGSPTSASELAKAIHALLPTENYGLFHGTCEGDTNWADFTKKIYSLAGVKTGVKSVSTAEYKSMNPQSTDRPAYSILDNMMLRLTGSYTFAHWEQAIEEYLKDEGVIGGTK